MNTVKLTLNEKGKGKFYITEGTGQIGEMVISISGNDLTAHHTEVDPKYEGKGFAKELLKAMVAHARENELKVIPLCPYVLAQFKRNAEEYQDVWKKNTTD